VYIYSNTEQPQTNFPRILNTEHGEKYFYKAGDLNTFHRPIFCRIKKKGKAIPVTGRGGP
jgi:hypothetical protein